MDFAWRQGAKAVGCSNLSNIILQYLKNKKGHTDTTEIRWD